MSGQESQSQTPWVDKTSQSKTPWVDKTSQSLTTLWTRHQRVALHYGQEITESDYIMDNTSQSRTPLWTRHHRVRIYTSQSRTLLCLLSRPLLSEIFSNTFLLTCSKNCHANANSCKWLRGVQEVHCTICRKESMVCRTPGRLTLQSHTLCEPWVTHQTTIILNLSLVWTSLSGFLKLFI